VTKKTCPNLAKRKIVLANAVAYFAVVSLAEKKSGIKLTVVKQFPILFSFFSCSMP
jgi:hypothetical protein